MAFIVTPGQFSRRSEFYHQLAQLTAAGLGLIQALEQLERHPPSRSYRGPIHILLKSLAEGYTFADSLQRTDRWLPAFDIALLNAGEQSGRLDACFRLLADYYTDRARIARQMLADLMYPAFLFHFAIFILPFSQFFLTGNVVVYLSKTFGVLIPVYVILALMVYAMQGRHGENWRRVLEIALHPVPILGTARRYLALSRLCSALEALLNAGVSIIQGWELAATASGSPILRSTVVGWRREVDGGQTPAEVLRASGRFPDLFVNQYASGEISGKLDETLKRLSQYFQEEGTRKLRAVAQWTPRGVYLFVAFMIAYRVIHFYMDYFQQVGKAAGW